MDRNASLQALNMKKTAVEIDLGGRKISIETGYLAKQANGSVIIRSGDTMVLSTVCDGDPRPGLDFFPLTVDYREKHYAAGRIPGNFFKREARPSEHETLISRLTDRPLRPLFPAAYKRDTSCQSVVISFDQENESDVMSMNGVSAAIHISSIPFSGPLGAVRIGMINDKFIINPYASERKDSVLDLIVAGTADAITMVECGAQEVTEDVLVKALVLAHEQIKKICTAIDELRVKVGKAKMEIAEIPVNPWLKTILDGHTAEIKAGLLTANKAKRSSNVKTSRDAIIAKLTGGIADAAEKEKTTLEIKAGFSDAKDVVFRELILEGKRVDGRDTKTVRPIVIDLDVIPRAHGSAVFTRGETQGLLVATLGTTEDEMMMDGLKPKFYERFLLHYNFPGFSVGEVEKRGSPGRREVGHGALARRALLSVLPKHEDFPYVIRVVSDILESNGSSSMATVCGGSMAMMAAGVPLSAPVAGIAMGLVMEGSRYAVLTDILGDEDHYGDMDFKVCGTTKGITALQMDIKIAGISAQIMGEALEQARQGRLHILDKMNEAITTHRGQLSQYAPQIIQVQIDPELIGKIIGKGGETIRRIQDETGCKLKVDDDGIITIASPDLPAIEKAKAWISDLTEMPEAGRVYTGRITSIKEFGAFVEFIPQTEGLVHISEWSHDHVATLEGIAKTGDTLQVKLVEVDPRTGKFRLSRKALIEETPEQKAGREERMARRAAEGGGDDRGGDSRPPRRDGGGYGDRGPRRDDRGPRR